jgi:hypothetical protein
MTTIDRVALDIRDAAGAQVQGSLDVTLTAAQWPPATTSVPLPAAPGALALLPPATTEVDFTLTHADYAQLSVHLSFDLNDVVYWSNNSCKCAVAGTVVTVTAQLGRIRPAPCAYPPYGMKARGDQTGVYLFEQTQNRPMAGVPPDWGFTEPTTKREYAGLSVLLEPINPLRRITEQDPGKPTATVLAKADGDGWERLAFRDASVDLRKKGGFRWLEYGAVGGSPAAQSIQTKPRFLIALWAPPAPDPMPTEGLDFVVFYSPSTATAGYPETSPPFRSNYPYVVKPDTVLQPYVILGARYFFSSYFAQQLSASGQPAILVMPIFPNCAKDARAQWTPFNTQAGIHRLLLEIALFLQNEGYGTSTDIFTKWNGATCSVGLPSPTLPSSKMVSSPPVPKLRNITLAGYSSGSMGLVPVLTTERTTSQTYPVALFGSDLSGWSDAWREFWALDLYFGPETGLKSVSFDAALLTWSKQGRDRRFRIYQSGYTLANSSPDAFYPALKKSSQPPVKRVSKTDANIWAEDWRDADNRWSASFFSRPYLKATAPEKGVKPLFVAVSEKDRHVHAFTAIIGFGHAASLRFAK